MIIFNTCVYEHFRDILLGVGARHVQSCLAVDVCPIQSSADIDEVTHDLFSAIKGGSENEELSEEKSMVLL